MKKYAKELEVIRDYALQIGADRARIVRASQLAVRQSARAKCYIPACKFYGSSIMCPPHNPLTPDITREIVSEYEYGILFQVDARVEDFVGEEWRTRHIPTELKHKEILARLEGKAFYLGFPRAMGFAAGRVLPLRSAETLRRAEGEGMRSPAAGAAGHGSLRVRCFRHCPESGLETRPRGAFFNAAEH